jgi:hypothetical protein
MRKYLTPKHRSRELARQKHIREEMEQLIVLGPATKKEQSLDKIYADLGMPVPEWMRKAEEERNSPLGQAIDAAHDADFCRNDLVAHGRINAAVKLVKAGAVQDLGNGQYLVTDEGQAYHVNGQCECSDFAAGITWCAHRLAVALVVKAAKIEAERGNSQPLEPSEESPTQAQHTTEQPPRQIDLVVTYEADGAGRLARIHEDGELAEYKTDGRAAEPPARAIAELYRWLQDNGYTPDLSRFNWLDRGQGRRRRRQVYVLGGA